MTAPALLTELAGLGVVVTLEPGGRLRCDAPRGTLTPELRDEIAGHKAELVAALASTAPVAATGASLPVVEASAPVRCADCGATGGHLFFELEGGWFLCAVCWRQA